MRIVSSYEPFFANWTRKAGRKPGPKQLKQAHRLARPGTRNALALAMALREQGVTQPQIIRALGTPHRNVIKRVVASKKAKVKVARSPEGRKVYRLSLNGQ